MIIRCLGFSQSSIGKESDCNVQDLGAIPGLGRSPAEGNGNPLCYSCLENPMDRGAWQATDYGVARVRHHWSDLGLALAHIFTWNYIIFS